MKRLLLAAVAILAVGCAGSSNSLSPQRFAGLYNGTWVNLDDATDAGTAQWTFSNTGGVNGHDFDPGRSTTFHVVGNIDGLGALKSTSTPIEGSPATLNGTLAFNSDRALTGVLSWGVSPVLHYRYTFTLAGE